MPFLVQGKDVGVARAAGFRFAILTIAIVSTGCRSGEKWYQAVTPFPEIASQKEKNPFSDDALEDYLFKQGSPKTREDAFRILLSTRVFVEECDSTVVCPPQISAFRLLLHLPDAGDVFLDLLHRGHAAGQLYGLCGLWFVDRDELTHVIGAFKKRSDSVAVSFADVTVDVAVSDLVDSPDAIRVSEGETAEEYLKNHENIWYDISGGGLPQSLVPLNVHR